MEQHETTERVVFLHKGATHELNENEYGDPRCPACGHDDVAMWADDGEADDADWYQCEKFSGGCGASGAVVSTADLTRTLNGCTVAQATIPGAQS